MAQWDATPGWTGEGREKALLTMVAMVGARVVLGVVAETVAMTMDVTVETVVVTMMGVVVAVGVESMADMVIVLVAELKLPSVGAALEATQ